MKTVDPILRKLAEKSCINKLNDFISKHPHNAGFGACWSHKREAKHCLGILQDLLTGAIICFHVIHHSEEESERLSYTEKHSKCMENIALEKIIERSNLNKIDDLVFVHHRDLTDHKRLKICYQKILLNLIPITSVERTKGR